MFESISFCTGNKTIEVNGQTFPLGELSVECLNITVDEYHAMHKLLQKAMDRTRSYEASHHLKDWFAANECFIRLDEKLRQYRLFRLIAEENAYLYEAREFTQQYSMYEIDDDYSDEHVEKVLNAWRSEDVSQPKPRELMIFPGSVKTKWRMYRKFTDMHAVILSDVASFNDTLRNFITLWMAGLDQLNPSRYAEALHDFLYSERSHKWISNPVDGTGFYAAADSVTLWYVPRETEPQSDQYKIYAYYEVQLLQTLLKTDFYRALEAGYTVRRCAYCKRFFLLKDARRSKYCDQPAPGDPKHTCAQLGYHFKGIKEAAGDSPRANSLRRCCQRIDRDCSRGNITREEKKRLYKKAKDLFHQAETRPGSSYEDFEESLASKNLYPLCGVVRRSTRKGRPKRGDTNDQ